MTSSATSVVAAPSAHEVLQIPVSQLVPSPGNPRKTIDEVFLAQLADSIKQLGVQVPLLVRYNPLGEGDDPLYEIVAGHRRFAAAQKLKLEAVPCIVREISDDEAREIMVVENLQREDLLPLEEAEALAKDYGVDAKKIRDQVKAEPTAKAKKKSKADPAKKANPEKVAKSGTCRYCGCTDARACEDGCYWVDPQNTVCSNPECVEKYEAAGRALPKVKAAKAAKSSPKAPANHPSGKSKPLGTPAKKAHTKKPTSSPARKSKSGTKAKKGGRK